MTRSPSLSPELAPATFQCLRMKLFLYSASLTNVPTLCNALAFAMMSRIDQVRLLALDRGGIGQVCLPSTSLWCPSWDCLQGGHWLPVLSSIIALPPVTPQEISDSQTYFFPPFLCLFLMGHLL
ncbi:UNVERIFIED_CONTAM: hypothetical protein K2H54_063342 [Gekko kuhli]